MHNSSVLYLSDLIAQLQVIRTQYGDIQVWVTNGTPMGPRLVVEDMMQSNPNDPMTKVLMIE
jgi:hypothetical protein